MQTQSKVAVVILALLAATAARGDNGVGFLCPAWIGITPIPPANTVDYLPGKAPDALTTFQVGTNGKLDFKVAAVNAHQSLECFYSENKDPGVPVPNTPGWVSIKAAIPNGMTCTVNKAKLMEFDCIPIGKPGTIVQPVMKR